jgi:hypothetical protein
MKKCKYFVLSIVFKYSKKLFEQFTQNLLYLFLFIASSMEIIPNATGSRNCPSTLLNLLTSECSKYSQSPAVAQIWSLHVTFLFQTGSDRLVNVSFDEVNSLHVFIIRSLCSAVGTVVSYKLDDKGDRVRVKNTHFSTEPTLALGPLSPISKE